MSHIGPWIVLTALAVIALIAAERQSWRRVRAVSKTLASTGFVAVALFGGALDSAYGQVVLVALVFSWWGDLFLLWSRRALFLAGLVSFLLGHVAFGAAFAIRGVDGLVLAAALAATVVPTSAVLPWLLPRLDLTMRRPVIAYIVVISVMVALAVGTVARYGNPWIVVAAVAFYLSDLAVARDRFVRSGFVNRLWGLPLYYGAQVLFALTVHS